MNFTPFETIDEVIKGGCIYWSLYDNTGKRLIFENNTQMSPEESSELLKRVISREAGEYCQIKLSARNSMERGTGGSTKVFGPYYYKLATPAPGLNQMVNSTNTQGVSVAEYIGAINQVNAEKMKLLEMELKQNEPGLMDKLLTQENINHLLGIFDKFATGFKNKNNPVRISGPAAMDEELNQAVNTLIEFDQGREALINIANAGPLAWGYIRTGLKDNKLIS